LHIFQWAEKITKNYINKVMGKPGKIVNQYYPINEEDGKTKEYIFL